jgi:hypothetical protein
MEGLTLPGRECNSGDFIGVASIVERAKNLEDVVISIFAQSDARLTLTSVEDDERRLMGMVTLPSGSEVCIAFPEKSIRKGRRLFDPKAALTSLADVGTPIIDPDWLRQRDKDFGITVLDIERAAIVRPSRFIDLILSYALSGNGQATLTRDFGPIARRRFGQILELQLLFLGAEESAGYEETVTANWDKLVANVSRPLKRARCNRPVAAESL